MINSSHKQLSIILDNLLPSQLYYLTLKNSYQALKDRVLDDITLMYINKSSMMVQPRLSNVHVVNLCGFTGDAMATSLLSFMKLLKAPIQGQKIYYIWDLEFMHTPPMQSSMILNLFRQEKVRYLCRCELHQKLLENNFGRQFEICKEFDLETIYEKTR